MLKKLPVLFLVSSLFTILFLPCPAIAQTRQQLNLNLPNANDIKASINIPDPPEVDGDFDVPQKPGMRVRVFVHKEKPLHTSSAALVCGLEDPDSSASVSPAGWKLPNSITYQLNQNSVPSSVGSSNLPSIVSNSFTKWSWAINNKVNFVRGSNTIVDRSRYDGRNIIAWGRLSLQNLGVTYIWYYPSTGQVAEVDTIMNRRHSWKWANQQTCAYSDSYDAENIMIHELGHWLGLDDEYDENLYQHNSMFGYGGKGEVKKVTLTTGDLQGAAAIYP